MENKSKEIETKRIKAGKRTYFFDLKKDKNEKYYLEITESKKQDDTFERYSIMVFEEEFEEFKNAINKILDFNENKITNFEEIRKEIPNAYNKWDEETDEELLKLYSKGTSISELTLHFNRSKGAIKSRLRKLFDLD